MQAGVMGESLIVSSCQMAALHPHVGRSKNGLCRPEPVAQRIRLEAFQQQIGKAAIDIGDAETELIILLPVVYVQFCKSLP